MITIESIEAMKPGQTIWDDGKQSVPGFGARCQLKRPSYVLKYRVNSRQRFYTIGRHGAPWTPVTARREAKRLLGEVVKGNDPAADKGALRAAPTVAELIDQYLTLAKAGKVLSARGKAKKTSTLITDS